VGEPLKFRSRVTNGELHLQPPGDTAESRRFRDLVDAFVIEFDVATESDMGRCRRAAAFSMELEAFEAQMARGQRVDVAKMATAANSLRRSLADLERSYRARQRAQRRA